MESFAFWLPGTFPIAGILVSDVRLNSFHSLTGVKNITVSVMARHCGLKMGKTKGKWGNIFIFFNEFRII